MGKIRVDLSTRKFHYWTPLKAIDHKWWLCRCDCGTEKPVNRSNLVSGLTKSCGCHRVEVTGARYRTHGESKTRLFSVWRGMHSRCGNPKASHYERYGGRGISICAAWSDFLTFKAWAISSGYEDALTIDRIDNEGNYEPGNCRWATRKEQALNRSTTTKTEEGDLWVAVAAENGIRKDTYYSRVWRGWTRKQAATTKGDMRGRRDLNARLIERAKGSPLRNKPG